MTKRPQTRTSKAFDLLGLDSLTFPAPGRIFLVGAGPGDPDLLTVKALKAIRSADVLVYDKLVGAEILSLANEQAELIFVGKSRSAHTLRQEAINQLLIDKALEGLTVVRLKGGDPFIFGRGGEELDAARAAGVEVDIIPGITAALGCAASAQIPLTHRDHASAVTFVAGQCRDLSSQNWQGLHGTGRTLVIYMGLNGATDIADKLISEGAAPDLPVAIVENGTRKSARVLTTTLDQLGRTVSIYGIGSPALLVVGDVAAHAMVSAHPLEALSTLQLALAAE
jgi:uroporphyrin-III C-methyltransferase